MEFVLVPLLLLAGLFASLDGGEEDGRAEPSDDDTLSGSGTDSLFGGVGDDLLTLNDSATGFGGLGDDTIRASGHAVGYGREGDDGLLLEGQSTGMGGLGNDVIAATDEAVGYGLEGDDALVADENATIRGGEGNDTLIAGGEALADGGLGNDVLFGEGDAALYGGAGLDTLAAADDARAYGGEGRDLLYGEGRAALYGGGGMDSHVLDDYALAEGGEGDDWFMASGTNLLTGGAGDDMFIATPQGADGDGPPDLTITDFEPGRDELAVLIGRADTSDLTVTISPPDGEEATVIEITEANDALVARFTLQRTATFDPQSLRFFDGGILDDVPFTGTLVTPGQKLTGTGTETVTGGAEDDEITLRDAAFGQGGGGNDLIFAADSTRGAGGAGDDSLIAEDRNTTLTGGTGEDLFGLDWSDEASPWRATLVTDFVAGEDRLAVILGDRDIATLTFNAAHVPELDATFVTLDAPSEGEQGPFVSFRLQGVRAFDLNDLALYGSGLDDPLDWAPDPAWTETLTGGEGADTLRLNDSQVGYGGGGNDVLIANDWTQAFGGAGNDQLSTWRFGQAYGGEGDDTLSGRIREGYRETQSLHGDAGNDLLSGDGHLYGGAGNDLLTPDADGSLFEGSDSYNGSVHGGDGDDTILGDNDAWEVRQGLPIFGGAGNDLIIIEQGGQIDAGAGNDVVITRLLDAVRSGVIQTTDGTTVHPWYQPTTLGAGADLLALDVLLTQADADTWSAPARSHVLADFNPQEDELALILPPDQAGAFSASFRFNADLGAMELRLDNEASSMLLLLQGVTEAFPVSAIAIYADEAAVQARAPYATL